LVNFCNIIMLNTVIENLYSPETGSERKK